MRWPSLLRCADGLLPLAALRRSSLPTKRWRMLSLRISPSVRKGPPYTPFATPKPRDRPWCADLPSHERANKARKESVPNKTKESPQQVSIIAWLLYMLRFVFVGDVLDLWSAFGGPAAQLGHLSIVLRVETVGNATLSIIYDSELRAHIQRLARPRGRGYGFHAPPH